MQIHTLWLIAIACTLAAMSGRAQGSFRNLDFESGTLIPIPGDGYGRVRFATAFPGWTGYINNDRQTAALYNNLFISSAGIGLYGVELSEPFQGRFTALLEAGVVLPTGAGDPIVPGDASLSQTGVVPADAKSILFSARPASGPFAVSLGAETLSLFPIVNGSTYSIYGADVQAWAGQAAELKFTVFANTTAPGHVNVLGLDSIQFSTQAVPEPSVLGLFGLGLLLLGRLWPRR